MISFKSRCFPQKIKPAFEAKLFFKLTDVVVTTEVDRSILYRDMQVVLSTNSFGKKGFVCIFCNRLPSYESISLENR